MRASRLRHRPEAGTAAALALSDRENAPTEDSRGADPGAETAEEALIAPVRVLYVGGLSHTGSTLMARVLGEVPGFFAAGEVYALAERLEHGDLCGCGVQLADCPFWTSVLQAAFPAGDVPPRLRTERRWIKGRTLPLLTLGLDRRALGTYRPLVASLYSAIAAVSGARVIVDSSKSPTYASILDRMPGIELSVLHLVRDPRPTSYSWSIDPHFQRTRGPACGVRWALWNLELEALAARRRRRFVRIRFEDFLEEPAFETRRALRLVGAENAELPFTARDAVRLPSHHMVEGHRSRFDTGTIAIEPNESWRRGLSTRRALAMLPFTAPVQLLYRYPLVGQRVRRCDTGAIA
jgi:hypothetical protein